MSPLLLSLTAALAAAPQSSPTQPPGSDPFVRHVFPPELVMKHSEAIGLSAEQRETIRAAIQEAQASFIDLQWQMQTESGRLAELLQQRPVDETAVLAQLDRILDLERPIKRTQFSLLIRIKNTLTPAQQDQLDALR